jgi:hypothetical protein
MTAMLDIETTHAILADAFGPFFMKTLDRAVTDPGSKADWYHALKVFAELKFPGGELSREGKFSKSICPRAGQCSQP